jgi:SdpC family antimicrobial peptide
MEATMVYKWRRLAVTAVALATTVTMTQAGSGPVLANGSGPAGNQPALSAASPAQDGRNLFQGVFFLTGPEGPAAAAAMRVPDHLVDANRSPEAAAYFDAALAKVAELDPAFFESFSASLRSGDPFAVEQALADGRQLLEQANEQLGAEAGDLGPNRPQYETHAFPLFLVAVAITVVAVASVAVGGNIAVLVDVIAASAPAGASSDLEREQAVSALTDAFAR